VTAESSMSGQPAEPDAILIFFNLLMRSTS
jgi:hypothetical protein